MENPDPTQFISIADHISALKLQQEEFDRLTEEKNNTISEAGQTFISKNQQIELLEKGKLEAENKYQELLNYKSEILSKVLEAGDDIDRLKEIALNVSKDAKDLKKEVLLKQRQELDAQLEELQ